MKTLNERYGVTPRTPRTPKRTQGFNLIESLKSVGIALTTGVGFAVWALAEALLG